MLGRMQMPLDDVEKAYRKLIEEIFRGSNVAKEIRERFSLDNVRANTSYDLIASIRDLTKEKPEFDPKPIKTVQKPSGEPRVTEPIFPDGPLKDPTLDSHLLHNKV
jgi:hypothetical protein